MRLHVNDQANITVEGVQNDVEFEIEEDSNCYQACISGLPLTMSLIVYNASL